MSQSQNKYISNLNPVTVGRGSDACLKILPFKKKKKKGWQERKTSEAVVCRCRRDFFCALCCMYGTLRRLTTESCSSPI